MVLNAALALITSIILVMVRMKEGQVYKKVLLAAFYAVFLFCTFYFARSATFFLRGDFASLRNQVIWLCLLAGAIFFFPDYNESSFARLRDLLCKLGYGPKSFLCDREESKEENKGINLSPFALVMREAGRLILFEAMSVLAFCTQELERLHMPCQIAGLLVIILCMAAAAFRYNFKDQERALDIRDFITLFLLSGIYYYFGFAINYRNTSNPADYVFHNVAILFVVFLLILFISANLNITVVIGALINPVWALIHYFVYQFRGSIFIPNDIRSAGTAATVAGQYEYFINSDIWRMCAFSFVVILIAVNCKKVRVMEKRKVFSITGTLVLTVLIVGVYQSNFIKYMHLPYAAYKQDEWYDNVGYTLGFIEIMKKNKVDAPDNYDEAVIKELADRYSDAPIDPDVILPNIVVVMNEAFADLGDVGEIETNIDYMPFYHSLSTGRDTAVGRTLVSVLGGNTCQSEYEFLTGNSLEFTPNLFPYTTEIHGDIYSLVTTLKSQGYHATATHPNVGTNWKRNVIYRYMQFDDIYFIDDYEDSEYIREFVSDKTIFDKILTWIDEPQPQFVFAVTMQNHGGYIEDSIKDGEELPVVRKGITKTEGIDEYLSLIYESDKALKGFVKKLGELDRPTVFVMFGDHFPMMMNELMPPVETAGNYQSEFEKSQVQYATPYIVYANYDVDLSGIPEYLSVNYLGSNVLDACGLKKTAYDNYLLDMQEGITAFNAFGFKALDGKWYQYSDNYPAEYRQKFNEYNILQYNSRYKNAVPEMFAVHMPAE